MNFNKTKFLQSASNITESPEDIGSEVAFVGRSNSGKSSAINVIVNQKINSLLTLNLSYLGRKSPTAKTIHTGMVQLRANF